MLSPTVTAHKATWTVSREVLQGDGIYKKQTVTAHATVTMADPAEPSIGMCVSAPRHRVYTSSYLYVDQLGIRYSPLITLPQ